MNTHLIVYKLADSHQTYKTLSEKIKNYPNWAKVMPRVLLIKTEKPTKVVRSVLSQLIPGDNVILVINVTNRAWASYHLDSEIVTWMKENV